jgi:hypothetical protein
LDLRDAGVHLRIYAGDVSHLYNDSVDDIMVMMESFPKEFLAAFGFSNGYVFVSPGFMPSAFTYLTLLGVMFVLFCDLVRFSPEKRRSHCQEFLYAKPVSRRKMFMEKLAAVLDHYWWFPMA